MSLHTFKTTFYAFTGCKTEHILPPFARKMAGTAEREIEGPETPPSEIEFRSAFILPEQKYNCRMDLSPLR